MQRLPSFRRLLSCVVVLASACAPLTPEEELELGESDQAMFLARAPDFGVVEESTMAPDLTPVESPRPFVSHHAISRLPACGTADNPAQAYLVVPALGDCVPVHGAGGSWYAESGLSGVMPELCRYVWTSPAYAPDVAALRAIARVELWDDWFEPFVAMTPDCRLETPSCASSSSCAAASDAPPATYRGSCGLDEPLCLEPPCPACQGRVIDQKLFGVLTPDFARLPSVTAELYTNGIVTAKTFQPQGQQIVSIALPAQAAADTVVRFRQ